MNNKMAFTVAFLFSLTVFGADAVITADKNQVNTACAADATTAGCADMKVGKGLLKCLHKYKKATPGFNFSDACQAAQKQFRADKTAGK